MTRHARDRARERFGLTLDRALSDRIFLAIGQGKAILSRRDPDGSEQWIVQVDGQKLRVVLTASSRIKTVMPASPNKAAHQQMSDRRKGLIDRKPEPRRQRGIPQE